MAEEQTSNAWRLVELTLQDQQTAIDRVYKGYDLSVDHVHRLLWLTAAVVAVLPPLLGQSKLPVNYWYVRRGVLSLFVTIAFGVAHLTVTQLILFSLVKSVAEWYTRLVAAIGDAAHSKEPDAIAKAFQRVEAEQKPRRGRWLFLIRLGHVSNVAQYSSFLYGVWNLFRAAYLA